MFPILYESAYLSIHTIWVFAAIALLTGSYLAVKRLKRARVNFNLFIGHSTSLVLGGLVLSRMVYFFSHKDAYFPALDLRTLKNVFAIWDHGLSFWGGAIGIFLVLSYKLWKAKEKLWRWFDALSVPVAISMIIGNIGAFLGGYSYGTPTELPWGVRYESFNVKYTVPVHPVQIYSVLLIILLLISLHLLNKKVKRFDKDGVSSLYLFSLFSLGSFGLEFLRGTDTLMLFGIRLGAILFLLSFLISSFLLYKRLNSNQSSDEPL